MNLVAILRLALSFASKLAEYVSNKRLMDAGAAEAMLKGINDANDAINRANIARANYDSLPTEADPQDRANSRND